MNNLQVTAKSALSVLHRVQLGLERIVNDTGSAELLPTIRDQIKDALKIIDMEIEGASRQVKRIKALECDSATATALIELQLSTDEGT